MSNGSTQMQTILANNSGVQALITSFIISAVTEYAVFNSKLIPKHITTDSEDLILDVEKKTINHFSVSSEGGGHVVKDLTRQVSCRAYEENIALEIQEACFTALNRVKSSDKKAFFVADKMPIIEPQNSADNYNAPLNVRTITVE